MKRISSSFFWVVARLCAVLAVILGCSSKCAPDKPHEIRWQGQQTGYQGTTVVQPGDDAHSDSKRQCTCVRQARQNFS
jgi:hypothetical protein